MRLETSCGFVSLPPRLWAVEYAGKRSSWKLKTGWAFLRKAVVLACTSEEAIKFLRAERFVICVECIRPLVPGGDMVGFGNEEPEGGFHE